MTPELLQAIRERHAARLAYFGAPRPEEPLADTDALLAEVERLQALAKQLADAIHFTQEYVGDGMLPWLPGWSWYDALKAYEAQVGVQP